MRVDHAVLHHARIISDVENPVACRRIDQATAHEVEFNVPLHVLPVMDELLLETREDVGRAVALDRHVARREDKDPQGRSARMACRGVNPRRTSGCFVFQRGLWFTAYRSSFCSSRYWPSPSPSSPGLSQTNRAKPGYLSHRKSPWHPFGSQYTKLNRMSVESGEPLASQLSLPKCSDNFCVR
jgi:hypothetical protein